MFTAFTRGLNVKTLTLAVFAVFIYVLFSDYLIHEVFLKSTYQATLNLWRAPEEMGSYMGYMLFGQFLMAKFFTVIFAKGYEGKGIGEGLRFGFLVGLFCAGSYFINYAVSPMPASLLWAWVVAGIVQLMGAGAVAALVYKR